MYEKKSNRINSCGGDGGIFPCGLRRQQWFRHNGRKLSFRQSGASAESGAADGSGVITDNFANVDTNGTTVTFWHSMGGVNGEQWIIW